MIYGNPVHGIIHPPTWIRPAGNHDLKLTQDFGPTSVTAEAAINWPGGEGIKAGYYPHFHRGIDLGNGGCGAEIIAARSGIVRVAAKWPDGNIHVFVDHGSSEFSVYLHLHDEVVSPGQKVAQGALLGHLGTTGLSTACHLHFGIKRGASASDVWHTGHWIDPWPHLAQNVTIMPKGPGVNIRSSAGSGSTLGPVFAQADDDGYIRRVTDKVSLGATSARRRWGGTVTGASYTIGGVTGTKWQGIWLDGALRFIASPLALLSAT